MFNPYHWENYLKSSGQEVVDTFDGFLQNGDDKGVVDLFGQLFRAYSPSEVGIRYLQEDIQEAISVLFEARSDECPSESVAENPTEGYTETIENLWWFLCHKEAGENLKIEDVVFSKETVGQFLDDMPYWSTLLSYCYSDHYIPYFFQCLYNVLQSIADYFDITLPPTPMRGDYKGRFMHYEEICRAFQQFRADLNWSPAMLWAFLYDFAPKSTNGKAWIWEELPKARSAYFIGSGPNDLFLPKDEEYSGLIIPWQSNPDAQPGDIHVMYYTSPASGIGSIWKAVSPGFVDPFFYYYRCAYIGRAVRLPLFSLQEIKKDDALRDMNIVKKNMQGVNGTVISAKEYNHIVNHFVALGVNEGTLEKIDYQYHQSDAIIENEADVEFHLMEPLLEKLGWQKRDFVRQMPLRMGCKHTVYPDYAILPDFTIGREKAFWVWEAKKSIQSKKQLEIDLGQAMSYARRLSAKGLGLAAKEGIWLAQCHDDFKKLKHHTWKELADHDVFSSVYQWAGKRNLK